MKDDPGREYPKLYFELCDCAGPQPSPSNPKNDEHLAVCPYRVEVENDAQELP